MTRSRAVCAAALVMVAPRLFGQTGHGLAMPGLAHGVVMYHAPRWSPDGRWIVTTAMSDSGSHVLVLPASGGPPRVVPTGTVRPIGADWKSDGRLELLVEASGTPSARYVVDVDGKRLQRASSDSIASATPDSAVLLFEQVKNGLSAIVATDRTRKTARPLTRGFWAEQGTISPDGKSIVFEKRIDPNDMAGSEIVIMDLWGAGQRTIAAGTDPSWAPDGSLVLFKAMDANGALWVSTVDVRTKHVTRLARGVLPQWSPDGSRIVFMRDEADGGGNVMVMTRTGLSPRCLTCKQNRAAH